MFALYLRRYRYLKNHYQRDTGSFIGVSQQAISLWELGGRIPEPIYWPDLAAYLDISIDFLKNLLNL
jgi:transcriptional regulator with XRE-family HTH domain